MTAMKIIMTREKLFIYHVDCIFRNVHNHLWGRWRGTGLSTSELICCLREHLLGILTGTGQPNNMTDETTISSQVIKKGKLSFYYYVLPLTIFIILFHWFREWTREH